MSERTQMNKSLPVAPTPLEPGTDHLIRNSKMNIESRGIMALWNDCAADRRDDYEIWYQTEHLYERLAIDGILRGRRYESTGGSPQFFTYYELTSAMVLHSQEYLQRVNNPTEMTSRIMSGTFTNMSRTACDVIYRKGRLRGGYAGTFKFAAAPEQQHCEPLWTDLAQNPQVARTELWVAASLPERQSTTEENMRGGDSSIASCLFVECLTEQVLSIVVDTVSNLFAGNIVETGSYQLLCELETD